MKTQFNSQDEAKQEHSSQAKMYFYYSLPDWLANHFRPKTSFSFVLNSMHLTFLSWSIQKFCGLVFSSAYLINSKQGRTNKQ